MIAIWLSYDWEQCKVHVVDILKKTCLGLVPLGRLRWILGDELLAFSECEDMVEEVVKLTVTKKTALPPLMKSHPELFASRNTITANIHVVQEDESRTMLVLKCSTDSACYKLTKVPDIPNKLPLIEYAVSFRRGMDICDVIWENPPHVAQGKFAEINKIL